MKKKVIHLSLSLYLECKALTFIKVKAHKRILNGKVIMVRSYYRRFGERRDS